MMRVVLAWMSIAADDFDERLVSLVEQLAACKDPSVALFDNAEAVVVGVSSADLQFPLLPITDTPTLDVSTLGLGDDGVIRFRRDRAVRAKQVRGKVRALRRHIVQLNHAEILKSGRMKPFDPRHFGSDDAWLWTNIDPRRTDTARGLEDNLSADEDRSTEIQAMCGIQFRRPYDWRVEIMAGQCSLGLSTDARGAAAAFHARDIPDGRKRRAALRNWIRQHWRRRRALEEGEAIRVREHLRGATQFAWNGYQCRLHVSQFDLEKNEAIKAGESIAPYCSCGSRCDGRWTATMKSSLETIAPSLMKGMDREEKRLTRQAIQALGKPCSPGPVFPQKKHARHGCAAHRQATWLAKFIFDLVDKEKTWRVGFDEFPRFNEANDRFYELTDGYYDRFELFEDAL